MDRLETSDGKVWYKAPNNGLMVNGAVSGVWIGPNEEVDWHWAHTPEGSYVNGYVVRKKLDGVREKSHES